MRLLGPLTAVIMDKEWGKFNDLNIDLFQLYVLFFLF